MWLCKNYANFKKICKQFFCKDRILIKNLGVKCYNNHVKKNIDKWV